MNRREIWLFCGLMFMSVIAYSQVQVDEQLWAVSETNIQLTNKFKLTARPIIRFNNGISQLENASMDFVLRYQIDSNWSAALLSRSFYETSGRGFNFLFYDIAYKNKNLPANLTLSSYIRFHHAFAKEREIADFLRLDALLSLNLKSKFTPLAGLEPWLRFNGINKLTRVRYKIGFNWAFAPTAGLNVQYWKQQGYNSSIRTVERMFIVKLYSNISKVKKE